MVDEFMVCVDRIIASAACFEGSSSESDRETSIINDDNNAAENVNAFSGMVSLKKSNSFNGKDIGEGSSTKERVKECRICQEEDEEKDMEAPCACNGTLKFAHRKCIQRWCNKKGGITCEICYQVFSPNYTIPPPRSNADVMTIDIRQAWAQQIGLRDPHFLSLTTADHQFLQSDYEDYTVANSGTLACFRSVVIVLMLLLLIRQTLMVTRDFGMVQASSGFFHYQISVLQLAGILIPCYVVVRSWYTVQCRRRRQTFFWDMKMKHYRRGASWLDDEDASM